MPVDLIVLAAVAVFILLRLYGVLGQNVGHDESRQGRDATFDNNNKVIELTPRELERNQEDTQKEEDTSPEPGSDVPEHLRDQVREIRTQDPSFRMKHFLEGANSAFEMILESYSKDDRDTLRHLLSKSLYEEFVDELKQRRQAERYTDTTLVSIEEAEPVRVELEDKKVSIAVRFLTEQISVDRTPEGEKIEGTTTPIEQVEDEITFTRDLRSLNPNWKIVSMG